MTTLTRVQGGGGERCLALREAPSTSPPPSLFTTTPRAWAPRSVRGTARSSRGLHLYQLPLPPSPRVTTATRRSHSLRLLQMQNQLSTGINEWHRQLPTPLAENSVATAVLTTLSNRTCPVGWVLVPVDRGSTRTRSWPDSALSKRNPGVVPEEEKRRKNSPVKRREAG